MIDFERLSAPFRPDDVSWRAQAVVKRDSGYAAMALAYMDARDVLARLDEVCGPANWQTSYQETAKGRVICTISIRVDGEWISKSDGAGDTAVEGEKGALSDALKRAAVQWGIGRYLYDMGTPWGDCDAYEKNGKIHFKKWLPSAHAKFRQLASNPPGPRVTAPDDSAQTLMAKIAEAETMAALISLWKANADFVRDSPERAALEAAKDARKAALTQMDQLAA